MKHLITKNACSIWINNSFIVNYTKYNYNYFFDIYAMKIFYMPCIKFVILYNIMKYYTISQILSYKYLFFIAVSEFKISTLNLKQII